jgi:cell division protease FtsH
MVFMRKQVILTVFLGLSLAGSLTSHALAQDVTQIVSPSSDSSVKSDTFMTYAPVAQGAKAADSKKTLIFAPSTEFDPTKSERLAMKTIAYSEAYKMAQSKEISAIVIEEQEPPIAFMRTVEGGEYKFYAPNLFLDPIFLKSGATLRVEPEKDGASIWLTRIMIVAQGSIMILMVGAVLLLSKKYFSSPARQYKTNKGETKLLFKDVAGHETAKEELLEIVEYLKNPKKITALGGRVPRGALLVGPPGNGKTTLARATANEAGVPFLFLSGAEILEMFAGLGASRIRKIFNAAKKKLILHKGCIIFIDEIDVVGTDRKIGGSGDVKEDRNQTLTQILTELDGIESVNGVVLIGATNRPEVLDPALLRQGRLELMIEVPGPSRKDREMCFTKTIERKKIPVDVTVSAARSAQITTGMSYSDCAGILNLAAIKAAREGAVTISMKHIVYGRDRIRMGIENRGLIIGVAEKKILAYHEAGHAVMSLECQHSDPIERATILPHGRALGHVMKIPEEDKYMQSYAYLRDILIVTLAGRQAEKIIFGEEHITNGAAGDIKAATDLARTMICNFGMTQAIGFVHIEPDQSGSLPEAVSLQVFEQTKAMMEEASKICFDTLIAKRAGLDAVAGALLSEETIDGDEVRRIYMTAIANDASQRSLNTDVKLIGSEAAD